jgi:hypothetical protein
VLLLERLVRREMTVKPPSNLPRWITAETDHGPLRALAFVINRQSRFYTVRLPPEENADVLARACGHWDSCAEDLHSTVAQLEEQGIRDRNLWHLQALVAERIKPKPSAPADRRALQDSWKREGQLRYPRSGARTLKGFRPPGPVAGPFPRPGL